MSTSSFLSNAAQHLVQTLAIIMVFSYFPKLPPHIGYDSYVIPAASFNESLLAKITYDHVEKLFENEIRGPEAFAVHNGELYISTHGGYVQKLVDNVLVPVVKFGHPCDGYWQEHICGRPLGLVFDREGSMYVADAYYGIVKVDMKSGNFKILVPRNTKIGGKEPKLPNGVAVTESGLVYWTDSSTTHELFDGAYTVFGNATGRLLVHNQSTGENKVLVENLRFPNGLLLSEDERYLIIAETFENRLHRYHLVGDRAGTSDVIVELPGCPDNIQQFENGTFTVGIVASSDPTISFIARSVTTKRFLSRSIYSLQALCKTLNLIYPSYPFDRAQHWLGHFEMMNIVKQPSDGLALVIDFEGNVLKGIVIKDRSVGSLSSVLPYKEHYYLGSPYSTFLARVNIK